jgi:hypothetical protein
MKNIEKRFEMITLKLDRIYAHLEVDWDKLSERELIERYNSLRKILKNIKEDEKQT